VIEYVAADPDVIVQKSTREGFGLTVTEGLWKGRPTIGGDVGGSRCRSRTASPGISSSLRPSATNGVSRCWRSPRSSAAWLCWARSTCAASSSHPRLLRDDLRLFSDLQTGKIGR